MLPRTEYIILRKLALMAVGMAIEGHAADGYASLLHGLGRAQGLRDAGEPCGEALVVQYRQTLSEYACRYGVARD